MNRIASFSVYLLCVLGPPLLMAQTTAFPLPTGGPRTVTVSLMDAVSAAVSDDSSVKLAGLDVDASRARLLRAQGAFDTRVTTQVQEAHTYYPLTNYQHSLALSAGIDTFSETLNFTQYAVDAQKLTSSGIQFEPSWRMSRAADNLENLGGVNRTNLNFQVLFPLLRGRGRQFTTAPLRLATLDLNGRLAQQRDTAARTVYATVEAYWRYVAAHQRLQQARAELARSTQLNESVSTLIQADRLPASGSHQAQADMASHESGVLFAQQVVLEARQALGDAMALDPLDSLLIGAPGDALPEPQAASDETDAATLISAAMLQRADLDVSKERIDAAMLEQKTAASQLRSRLDLKVESGYTGLQLGSGPLDYVKSTESRVQGADVQASLTYTWDHANNDARGHLEETRIDARRAQEADSATRRAIGSEVITALGELHASTAALVEAKRAEDELRQVRTGAQDRLIAAAGVLGDVLTAEDALSSAELATIEARARYALAVARLRYATGTLLGSDPKHPSLERINLVTPPER
jgi:outer membrane protein TolC